MSEICSKCGLPKELCICSEIGKEQARLKVYLVKRKYGKPVTITDGISKKNIESAKKKLKSLCACGGTIKGSKLELQGNHLDKVYRALDEEGYNVEKR